VPIVIFSFTNYIKFGKQNEFNFDNMIVYYILHGHTISML